MKKQIIKNDEQKLNIVILIDEENGIKVKGIAKCHEEDVYNPELGANLANTKAWLKYYEKLEKYLIKDVACAKEMLKAWEDFVSERQASLERARVKSKEIEEEYEKLIETI